MQRGRAPSSRRSAGPPSRLPRIRRSEGVSRKARSRIVLAREEEIGEIAADRLRGAPAEQRLGLRVPPGDDAVHAGATTAERTSSRTNVSRISGHAPGGRARSGTRQASTSNHTRVGGPSWTPHRSASSSTRYRPHPPLPSALGGPGGEKPPPVSSTSTCARSPTTWTRMMTVASDPSGPCLIALVTTSLASSRRVSRHAGRRRGSSCSSSRRARATVSAETG